MHEARRLLDDLGTATAQLGDAFIEAGFPPRAWRAPDAQLDALNGQLPNVTMEALLMRLATFATSTGPGWLAGDGAALGAFAREAQMLARAVGPLRSLAERQRIKPSSARGPRPLERALGDERVGAQMDRLAYTLRVLMELAPQLEPVPTAPADISSAPAAPASKAAGKGTLGNLFPANAPPRFEPQPRTAAGIPMEHETYGPDEAASWLLGEAPARSPEVEEARWPVSRLLQRVWPPRRQRMWAVVLVACLLVLGVSGVLARALIPPGASPSPSTAPLLSGRAASTAVSGTALASPTSTSVTATVVAAAHLVLSPTSIILPCSGASVTLKMSNTGGQALTWHASVSGNAVLSATSGSLDPQSSTTITVHASSPQHGTGAIIFTSDGGTSKVTFKVSCR